MPNRLHSIGNWLSEVDVHSTLPFISIQFGFFLLEKIMNKTVFGSHINLVFETEFF